MRSRYSAYVLALEPYLLATWHPDTRPEALGLDDGESPRWLGLDIKAQAQQDEANATVEFVARSKVGGRAFRLHERSRFRRQDGQWFYVDGEFPEKPAKGGKR